MIPYSTRFQMPAFALTAWLRGQWSDYILSIPDSFLCPPGPADYSCLLFKLLCACYVLAVLLLHVHCTGTVAACLPHWQLMCRQIANFIQIMTAQHDSSSLQQQVSSVVCWSLNRGLGTGTVGWHSGSQGNSLLCVRAVMGNIIITSKWKHHKTIRLSLKSPCEKLK